MLILGPSSPSLLDVSLRVAEKLGVDPDRVDVVLAGDAPCVIIVDAWRHGITVYEEEPGRARERLLTQVIICHDYKLMRERLGVPRTAVKAIRRRSQSGNPLKAGQHGITNDFPPSTISRLRGSRAGSKSLQPYTPSRSRRKPC